MATVYRATDTSLNREVALKMVHPHLLQQPETLKRFTNEARAIAALSHEHIIRIYDFGETESQPFIVMEYIDGMTLEELILRDGALPNIVTIEIASQILDGLICAHKNGVFHRDIKPGNILIDRAGCLRITDFGIAYLVHSESITMTGSFLGSPHYISPEQVSGRKVQGNTDIFSLGVVLYQSLCGMVPFDAETPHGVIHALLYEKAPCISQKISPVLFWLEDFIEECLIKDPQARPDAEAARERLMSACSRDSITVGQYRLADFLNDSGKMRNDEQVELFSLYRKRAVALSDQRQEVAGLRMFEQAARFGVLSETDRRRMRRGAGWSRLRRLVRRYYLVPILAVAALLITILFVRRLQLLSREETISAILQKPADKRRATVFFDTAVPSLPEPVRQTEEFAKVLDSVNDLIGEYSPGMIKAGNAFRQAGSRADIGSDSPVPDTLRKVPEFGFLECLTRPPWVNVDVDGVRRGVTPTLSTVPLDSGRHVLRLKKNGYADVVDTLTIVPSGTTRVRISLSPLQEAGAAK
jgi:serine/threonine-protein kinase